MSLRSYSRQEWRVGALLFVSFLALYLLRMTLIPHEVVLYPAAGIAMAGLFFGGLGLWPVVFLAAGIGGVLEGLALPLLLMHTIAHTVQASIGAYLLRQTRVDPLFRRYRDTFSFLITIVGVSAILPALMGVAYTASGLPNSPTLFAQAYIAMLASLLIVTPFILRWFAKPRFSRTPNEWVELAIVFLVLVIIDSALFIYHVTFVAGIELLYFLAIPMFWLALRHRPRWVTLALLATALFAIGGELVSNDPATLATRLYEIEALLILIAMSFFIIVSLEEDRRVNNALMRNQLITLENAIARVTSESKAKNDFIAILAHELRNPLAPILSSIELMKLKGMRDVENQNALLVMEERMETVRRLLDDLLDISRISEGKVTLNKEVLDLESVIRRAVLSTDHYIKERHQTLVLKLPKKGKFVLGDPVRLEQIFSNLLTNASKYSESGDTITLKVGQVASHIEISVTDEGIGIPAGQLESIFTPFHQIEEGGRGKRGLGIGLALVRSFVHMHGGTVVARSAGEKKGSQFIVTLPLLPESEQVIPEVKKVPRASLPKRSGFSILVVDDNDAAAAGIGRLLELRGCRVSYAYDGGQTLERVQELSPSVVLLDVGLPDMDGYTVAKTLRTRGYTGKLIALSGYSTDEAKRRGVEAGFDHYLVKPAGLADLKHVIPELT